MLHWDACESEVEAIFEEAVALNPLSTEMWGEYINWRLQLVSVGTLTLRERRVDSLLTLIRRVVEAGVANENIHVSYLKFLREEGLSEEFDSLLTQLHPDLLKMPSLLQEIGPNLTQENLVFLSTQLISSTQNSRLLAVYPVETWNVLLDLYLTPDLDPARANGLIEALYRLSLSSQESAIAGLLLKLLTWSSANESAEEFRAKYHRLILASTKTWPLRLYTLCSQYEAEAMHEQNACLVLDRMASNHGSSSVEVWLEFIRVKRRLRDFKGAGEGHWRAMKNLRADLVEEFVSRFTSQTW